MDNRVTPRPGWLVASLAAVSAIVAFRISGVLNVILFNIIELFSFNWLNQWEFHFGLVLGLVLAILCSILQDSVFKKRTLRANHTLFVVLILLAVLPLRLNVTEEYGTVAAPKAIAPLGNVEPVTVVCKLIDGETILESVVINNSHISKAMPQSYNDGETWEIQLTLTDEGQRIIKNITSRHIDKRLGFWIDGDLKCSPVIRCPILGEHIRIAIEMNLPEAKRLAEGIMKGS